MFVPSTISRAASVFLGVLFGLFFQAPAHGADDVRALRLRWIPGRTYVQETTTETFTALTAIGQPEDQKMTIKQTTRVDVTEKDAGNKEARVTFMGVTGETQAKGQKMSFDSAHPEAGDPLLRKTLGKSVGASFVLIYDQNNQFSGVRDTGAMAPSSEGTPTLPGIVQSKEVAELYRRSLEMGLPKSPVKPGDRWSSQETVKFPSAGTVIIELRAKFEAIADYDGHPHAKVTFEGGMRGDPESSGRVSIGAGSTTSGEVLFDLERETVSSATFHAKISLEINGKKIPVRQDVTTKLVSLEPTPASR